MFIWKSTPISRRRCTQRRNNRIYQHLSVPEIVTSLLGEWDIDPAVRLDQGNFPRHEYRVQYGENDFAFVCRLLEQAGIIYHFEQLDPTGEGQLESMQLVLSDAPHDEQLRSGGPIPYVGNTDHTTSRNQHRHTVGRPDQQSGTQKIADDAIAASDIVKATERASGFHRD